MPNFFIFHRNVRRTEAVKRSRMNNMTLMKIRFLTLVAGGIAALTSGCVERRVEYVPTYQVQPAYQAAPAYTYAPQTAYQGAPVPTDQSNNPAPVAPQAAPVAPPADNTAVAQAPPPPQAEVVPVAPGPEYVWAPG